MALVRSLLPILRHRLAKVRAAACSCVRACIMVPDLDKCKGAGSDCIPELIGFREENNLSVASFYTAEIRLNYLAELVTDTSVTVKERLVDLLTSLLTIMQDRYDHQTRLVPYLLDLMTDPAPHIAEASLNCLKVCGQMYEEEHMDDILEKRQYGVDGDEAKLNLDRPPITPFKERPRIGVRLYVRGNVKRFITALVNELTNWVTKTRLKSAHLLRLVVYLCEEHLTIDAHTLFPSLIKALHFARQDNDVELHQMILEVCEVMGRYTLPETYIHYILPRLRGDVDISQYGADVNMRISILQLLSALLSGTKPGLLVQHFTELVNTLTNSFVIDVDSSVALRTCALDVILTVLHALVRSGRGKAAVEAHFLATGRLTTLKTSVYKLFYYLQLNISSDITNDEFKNKSRASVDGVKNSLLAVSSTTSGGSINENPVLSLKDRSSVALILLGALDSVFKTTIPNSMLGSGALVVVVRNLVRMCYTV